MFRKNIKSKIIFYTKEIIKNLIYSIIICLLLIMFLTRVFNIRIDEVLSNSMSPIITNKDIVIVAQQKEYGIGDIVEFRDVNNIIVAHKIIDFDSKNNLYKISSNNNEISLVAKNQILGKVVMVCHNGRIIYNFVYYNYFKIIIAIIVVWLLLIIIDNKKYLSDYRKGKLKLSFF